MGTGLNITSFRVYSLKPIIKIKLFVLFTLTVSAARREQVPTWVNPEEQAQVVTVRKQIDLTN